MPARAKASIIFALFGALTAFAILIIRRNGAWPDFLDTEVLMVVVMAAVSAALVAALIAPSMSGAPVAMGMLTMLLAQIPFSVLATLWVITESPHSNASDDALSLFGMALVGGWYVAGLYQIAAGALAGWFTHRMTRQ